MVVLDPSSGPGTHTSDNSSKLGFDGSRPSDGIDSAIASSGSQTTEERQIVSFAYHSLTRASSGPEVEPLNQPTMYLHISVFRHFHIIALGHDAWAHD